MELLHFAKNTLVDTINNEVSDILQREGRFGNVELEEWMFHYTLVSRNDPKKRVGPAQKTVRDEDARREHVQMRTDSNTERKRRRDSKGEELSSDSRQLGRLEALC